MNSHYATYVKPELAKVLKTVGQNISYSRADGDYLYYQKECGGEVKVLDLLGGYGATLLGHNHPDLLELAQGFYQSRGVMHAQFSLRESAGKLAKKINDIMVAETQLEEGFITTFSNSGAEAVEVALKHAEFSRVLKILDIITTIEKDVELAKSAVLNGEASVPDNFFKKTSLVDHYEKVDNIEQVVMGLLAYNTQQFDEGPQFIALDKSFHGKLISSVQLTYGDAYRLPFKAFGLNARFVEEGDEAELQRLAAIQEKYFCYTLKIRDEKIALEKVQLPRFGGVLVEPIQGEGGINTLSEDFALALRRFCNLHDCPLIVDEIQSGMGRTGKFLASSHCRLKADYYTFSKSLGGGLSKIAATVIRRSLYKNKFGLVHSSTFAEDNFSSEVALKTLELLEANAGELYKQAEVKGLAFIEGLQRIQLEYPDVVASVRGKGLMIGLEFKDQSESASIIIRGAVYSRSLGYMLAGYLLREHHVRVSPPASAPNILRIEPSVYISDEAMQQAFIALERVCLILRHADALPLVAASINMQREGIRSHLKDFSQNTFNPPEPVVNKQKVTKVAFVNHLITAKDIVTVDPSLKDLNEAECIQFVEQMAVSKAASPFPPVRIKSATGAYVDFILYPLCVASHQMGDILERGELSEIRDAVQDRVDAAKADGCEVVGLGMYTSIVTNNAMSLVGHDMALTSGNALTTAMGVEAIRQAAARAKLDIENSELVVVGGAGNIASIFSSLLCESVNRITLLGSSRDGSEKRLKKTVQRVYDDVFQSMLENSESGIASQLLSVPEIKSWVMANTNIKKPGKALADKVREHFDEDPFCRITSDQNIVRNADIVLCAANAPEPFLDAESFKENAIICDIAVPHNVVGNIQETRSDIQYMQGGIVATPNGESLDYRARAFLDAGELYACMAESVVLGLCSYKNSYSYGDISKRQVKEIMQYAKLHGFALSKSKSGRSL